MVSWKTVAVVFGGTVVSALLVSGHLPSEMARIGWWDALYPPVLQGVYMALGTLGYQSPPGQRLVTTLLGPPRR